MKKNFFAAHKRVLIKIIPHHNESVYKYELSHFHLFAVAFCTSIVLLAFLLDRIAVVRAAQEQVKTLQTVTSSQRQELVRFSNQTSVMLRRLHQLQNENQEIRRLTAEVARKRVEPPHPRSARTGAPPAKPHVTSVSLATEPKAPALASGSLWQRFRRWIASQRDGGVSFASEATQLSLVDMELNQTFAQSRRLESQARAVADAERRRELAHERYLDDIPSIWPTDGYVSSGFGYRSYPDAEFHPGLDVVNDYGAPIYATASGIVSSSGWDDGGYGYVVRIDHGNGFETMYAHCSSVLVSAAQAVKKGQEVALIGTTGFATGPHVHYEVIRYGTPIDPSPYLNGVPTELATANPY